MNDYPVYILGDTHGRWGDLQMRLDDYDIKHCILISVGDNGIGFSSSNRQKVILENLNELFKERDIEFMAIRGNHDDPAYFDGYTKYSNLELLKDYTTREINGKKYLFVGGATSIDRRVRTRGQSYWDDEIFVLKPELVEECDVLITHSAPTWLGDFSKAGIDRWCQQDPTLWDECMKERIDHDILYAMAKPRTAFCGHFHVYQSGTCDKCLATIVDELGLVEFHQDEEYKHFP